MPCRDDGPPVTYETINDYKERLDKTTRLLCELARKVDTDDFNTPLTVEMVEWLKEHKEADRKRVEKELSSKKSQVKGFRQHLASMKKKVAILTEIIENYEYKLATAEQELKALYKEQNRLNRK